MGYLLMPLFLLLQTFSESNSKSLLQTFVKEPKSLSLREGDNVTLACSVDNKVGVLQWTRDDFGLGTDRELSGYSRYKMVGEEGKTWNLRIENVTLDDDAKFQCQVGATEHVGPIRSKYAIVKVFASPQPPIITAGPSLILREKKIALVQCISKGGRPASVIKWRRNGKLISDGIEEKVENLDGTKRMITVSSLTFETYRNISGSVLECEAINESDEESRKVSTTVEIEFEPEVSLTADRETVYEGDTVKISCAAEAFPSLVEYQWNVGGEEVKEARGAMELIIDADRTLNGKKVTCFARNKIGQSSADYLLDIKYSPAFVKSPKDVTGNNGQKISLECSVESNPPADYLWIKNNLSSELVGSGPILSFTLTNQSSGIYTCKATSKGFSPISSAISVTLRGPPNIVPGREVQFGTLGETVHVICEAHAVPNVQQFFWLYEGQEMRQEASNFSIVETQHGNVIRSTLIIPKVGRSNFGEYGCRVKNEMGEVSTVIKLKSVDALPLLIMVAAAIGGLLLTIVLIVIVMTCRKVAKTPLNISPGAKTSPQPDRFSNSSSDTKANTISSLSAPDDLDGSDSLPEYHANFMKSQPDVLPTIKTTYNTDFEPGWHGYGNSHQYTNRAYNNSDNYAAYRQFSSEHDLLDQNKYNNYSNPYLQSNEFNSHTNAAYGIIGNRADPMYSSGRFNAVAQKLEVMGSLSVEDLNESSIGTHV